MTKHKKRAKKIKLLKIEKVEPDTHVVELEIHGAPEPPPADMLPVEPIELDAPHDNVFVAWWKSLW